MTLRDVLYVMVEPFFVVFDVYDVTNLLQCSFLLLTTLGIISWFFSWFSYKF